MKCGVPVESMDMFLIIVQLKQLPLESCTSTGKIQHFLPLPSYKSGVMGLLYVAIMLTREVPLLKEERWSKKIY
jgi:hypothetical protein